MLANVSHTTAPKLKFVSIPMQYHNTYVMPHFTVKMIFYVIVLV